MYKVNLLDQEFQGLCDKCSLPMFDYEEIVDHIEQTHHDVKVYTLATYFWSPDEEPEAPLAAEDDHGSDAAAQ